MNRINTNADQKNKIQKLGRADIHRPLVFSFSPSSFSFPSLPLTPSSSSFAFPFLLLLLFPLFFLPLRFVRQTRRVSRRLFRGSMPSSDSVLASRLSREPVSIMSGWSTCGGRGLGGHGECGSSITRRFRHMSGLVPLKVKGKV